MIDIKKLRTIYREKLELTDDFNAAFTKAVWIAYLEGLEAGAKPHLCHVSLTTTDLEASIAFYAKLGFVEVPTESATRTRKYLYKGADVIALTLDETEHFGISVGESEFNAIGDEYPDGIIKHHRDGKLSINITDPSGKLVQIFLAE